MKKALIVTMSLMVCAAGFALDTTTDSSTKKAPPSLTSLKLPKVVTTEGMIKSLDTAASKLVLDVNGTDVNVSYKMATVWASGKKGKHEDLKEGQKVKIRHVAKGDMQEARSIEIKA
ncbi:MAG: hypothetical protein HYS07_06555 [Chlamydiae bacterium]|nr:hypothetical protein [Chlamydiota bacterium]MBI3277817.1 hypothetical protein [Chlamydiota bacterium]